MLAEFWQALHCMRMPKPKTGLLPASRLRAKMYLNYSSSRKNCLVNRNKCYVSYLIRKVDVDCLSSKIANVPKIRPESYRLHIVPHFGCDRLRILINLNITLWPMPGGISCAISEWLTVVVYLFYLTFKYLFLDMQTHVSTQQMNGNRRTLTTSISGPVYRIFSLADERQEKRVRGEEGLTLAYPGYDHLAHLSVSATPHCIEWIMAPDMRINILPFDEIFNEQRHTRAIRTITYGMVCFAVNTNEICIRLRELGWRVRYGAGRFLVGRH